MSLPEDVGTRRGHERKRKMNWSGEAAGVWCDAHVEGEKVYEAARRVWRERVVVMRERKVSLQAGRTGGVMGEGKRLRVEGGKEKVAGQNEVGRRLSQVQALWGEGKGKGSARGLWVMLEEGG